MEVKSKRNEALDQFRAICTIMVIVLHFVGKGGVLDVLNINSVFAWTLKAFSTMAVNGFVILSSFFMLEKEWKLKRILSLLLQVWLISVSATLIVFLFEKHKTITLSLLLEAIFPNAFAQYWFTACYIGLCLLSPFINCMLKNLDDKKLNRLVIIIFCLFCLWPTIIPSSPGCDNSGGYSLLWFLALYITTAWLKRNYKKLQTVNRWIYLSIFICCGVFATMTHYVAAFLAQNVAEFFVIYSVNIFWYSTLPPFLSAISLFLFFEINQEKRKSPKGRQIWKKIAESSLCIYLLQEQIFVRDLLWKKWIPVQKYASCGKVWILLFTSVCIIVLVGITINWVLVVIQRKIEKSLLKYGEFENRIRISNEK